MQNLNAPTTLRRSSRVPVTVPIMVTSLEPGIHFSEVCETSVVNAHGCALQSRVRLDTGTSLHLHSKEGRETTALVVSCQAVGSNNQTWRLGARLERPDNFWGLANCPKDWPVLPAAPVSSRHPQTLAGIAPATRPANGKFNLSSEAALLNSVGQLSDEDVKRMIAESVGPLHAEVMALKENLGRRETKRSRFEVSLSSIPPELEQQLELRVRKDLEPKVLDEARQQSAHLLAAAKATVDQRTDQVCQDFLHRLAEEVQAGERRAQAISVHVVEDLQDHLRANLEEFQGNLIEGGNRLKGLSEQLLQFLQQSLNEQHDARRIELERVRAAVAAESSRLEEQVEDLDRRITELNQSARALESGLDKRLSEMASNTVRNTRSELESVAGTVLQDSKTRNELELEHQLDEACENMKIIEKGILAAVSDSLKVQAADASRAFERSMEELARASVERWRTTLAAGLNAVVKNLGEQFQLQAKSVENDGNH
ncbi:MAG TPA: hypothetical protein VEK33_05590 [Terriglobales bacterium]|nr:hypothetical protein [Terriglobales bacterium]